MKKLLNTFLLAVAVAVAASASAEVYDYGYKAEGITLQDTLVSGEIKTPVIDGFGSGKYRNPHYGLLEMPEKVTTSFAGAQITSINFCPFITSEDSASVVISTEIGGTPLYEQRTDVKSHEWSNVILKTPFTIEAGQHLYIGYKIGCTVKEGPIGIYYTSNVMPKLATVDPILDYVAYEKDDGTVMSSLIDTQTWSSRRQTANLMAYATIEGNLPGDAISVDTMTLAKGEYIKPEVQQQFSTTVTNVGLNEITQFYMKVDVDGTTATEQNVTSIPLKPMEEKSFSMNMPQMTTGLHTVKVTIDYPNSMENMYTGRNNFTKEFLVYGDSVRKSVLLEHFTTAKCVNCIAGEERVDSLINSAKDMLDGLSVFRVNHHSGFSTDAMTTADDLEYEWFYGTEKGGYMWAPANMTDRRDFSAYGATGFGGTTSTGPIHGTTGLQLDSMMVIAGSTPAFVRINLSSSLGKNRELTVEVSGESLYKLPRATEKRLNVVLVEDGVVGTQKAKDGSTVADYVHNNVYRASLTGTWGEADVFDGTSLDKTYTYTLPDTWNADNMKVVAFISNYDPTNNKNCQVEQCAEAPLGGTGIREVTGSKVTGSKVPGSRWFNVAGQRVNDGAKGIIIINGKKVVR